MFLLAKYSEYVLKVNLNDASKDSNGVANVNVVRNAISIVLVTLEPYRGFLLQSITSKSIDQTSINNSVVDKVLKLDRIIVMTTMPTTYFTEASISVYVQ